MFNFSQTLHSFRWTHPLQELYMSMKHCEWNSWWQQPFQQINSQMLPSQCLTVVPSQSYFTGNRLWSICCCSFKKLLFSLNQEPLNSCSNCTMCSNQLDVPEHSKISKVFKKTTIRPDCFYLIKNRVHICKRFNNKGEKASKIPTIR